MTLKHNMNNQLAAYNFITLYISTSDWLELDFIVNFILCHFGTCVELLLSHEKYVYYIYVILPRITILPCIGHCCTILQVENSLEIALSVTLFEILTLFHFQQKSKMAAESGEK